MKSVFNYLNFRFGRDEGNRIKKRFVRQRNAVIRVPFFLIYGVIQSVTISCMSERANEPGFKPQKPTMLWDGDCRFCFSWIQRWQRATGDAVEYRPYQEALDQFPQVTEEECKKAVQLILMDGRVLRAAHAVLQSLAFGGRQRWMVSLYERSSAFRWITETAYRFVAANRSWLPH